MPVLHQLWPACEARRTLAFAYWREVPMRVTGAEKLHAPAEVVWAALADRDVLVRAIPGIEQLDVTGNGRGEFTVTTAIAAVSGTYAGAAVIQHADAPSALGLHVSAAGGRGTIQAGAVLRPASGPGDWTENRHQAAAHRSRTIPGTGQSMQACIPMT